jgi:Tfp pilus assembly pilus retraction ATPase PilT
MPEPIIGEQEAEKDRRKQRAIALFTKIFRPVEDFTIVIPDEYFPDDRWFDKFIRDQKPPEAGRGRLQHKPCSVEFGLSIPLAYHEPPEARIHAGRAFSGRAWSLTVRWKLRPLDVEFLNRQVSVDVLKLQLQEEERKKKAAEATLKSDAERREMERRKQADPKKEEWRRKRAALKKKEEELAKFAPSPDLRVGSQEYLVSFKMLVDTIFTEWRNPLPSTGFALVTGGTGTGKSNIVRGLIYCYLRSIAVLQTRSSHLITFEDPIEKLLRRLDSTVVGTGSPPKASDFVVPHIDYTPRSVGLGYDCPSVEEGLLKDALRQTPAVAYVGELRKPEEFVACLDFAATGHFVIATAHAGSVAESMAKALSAVEAKSPSARASYASRMLCVIHLKRFSKPPADTCPSKLSFEPIVVPAMWRRSQTAIQQLVADGLASVLPSKPSSTSTDAFCLGRAYFLDELLKKVASDRMPSADYLHHLRSTALEDDLNG